LELLKLHELGFKTWVTNGYQLLSMYGLNFDSNLGNFKKNCKQIMNNTFINNWTRELNNIEKNPILRTYCNIKTSFKMEPYLRKVKNVKYRNAICKLRSSSHNLEIERGRHCKPSRPVRDRLCSTCNVVEDEIHFITNCKLYNYERAKLFVKISTVIPEFELMPVNEKFIFLMCCDNEQVLTWVGKFIYQAFEKRDSSIPVDVL